MKSAHVDFGDFGVSKYVASDQCYGDSRVYVILRRRNSRNRDGPILYGFSLCLDKYGSRPKNTNFLKTVQKRFFHDSISEQRYQTFEIRDLHDFSLRIFHVFVEKTKVEGQ